VSLLSHLSPADPSPAYGRPSLSTHLRGDPDGLHLKLCVYQEIAAAGDVVKALPFLDELLELG